MTSAPCDSVAPTTTAPDLMPDDIETPRATRAGEQLTRRAAEARASDAEAIYITEYQQNHAYEGTMARGSERRPKEIVPGAAWYRELSVVGTQVYVTIFLAGDCPAPSGSMGCSWRRAASDPNTTGRS